MDNLFADFPSAGDIRKATVESAVGRILGSIRSASSDGRACAIVECPEWLALNAYFALADLGYSVKYSKAGKNAIMTIDWSGTDGK